MFGKSYYQSTIKNYAAPATLAVRDREREKWLKIIKEANPVRALERKKYPFY